MKNIKVILKKTLGVYVLLTGCTFDFVKLHEQKNIHDRGDWLECIKWF